MKNTQPIFILATLLTASASLYAASYAGAPKAKEEAKKDISGAAAVDMANMADGEVRKIDKENKKRFLLIHEWYLSRAKLLHAHQSNSRTSPISIFVLGFG